LLDRILFIELIQTVCSKVLVWLENIGARSRRRRRCSARRRLDRNGVHDTSKHVGILLCPEGSIGLG
jgi:uncharacterized membrane protein